MRKRILAGIIAGFLVAEIGFATTFSLSTSGQEGSTIFVAPGETFTVDVMMDGTENGNTFEIFLGYDVSSETSPGLGGEPTLNKLFLVSTTSNVADSINSEFTVYRSAKVATAREESNSSLGGRPYGLKVVGARSENTTGNSITLFSATFENNIPAGESYAIAISDAGSGASYTTGWKSGSVTNRGSYVLTVSSAIAGDANMDGSVDVGDLGILAANYGTTTGMTWSTGDFTGDGAVDVGDLGVLAANYGTNASGADFDADYAKVFGTESESTASDDTTDSSTCGSLGLLLIAGILLIGMLLINKLHDEDTGFGGKKNILGGLLVLGILTGYASAAIQITEWMYKGDDGEFVEFTNTGLTQVDMTDWSFSDSDATAGDLAFGSTFGVVEPGESVIITETDEATFRTVWSLSASVKIIGSNTNSQLGRGDEIHLYDADNNEVDSLVYDDEMGYGPRTSGASCTIPYADLNVTTALSSWSLASTGDRYGSYTSTNGDTGSPGSYSDSGTASLTGTVQLGNYLGTIDGKTVTVELNGESQIVTLDSNGQFTISGLTPGSYDICIKTSHWLANMQSEVGVSDATTLSTVFELYNGDVDEDNEITSTDLSLVLLAQTSGTGSSGADINGDGTVDGSDVAIVVSNMDLVGGSFNSLTTQIFLLGDSITANTTNATVDGTTVTITAAGTYKITGSLTDGQIFIDTEDEDDVNIILNGINVTCSTNAPFAVMSAEKVVVELAEGTENTVTDASIYVFPEGEDEPNATFYSKDDMTICGEGSLTVNANYNDGITSKDGLIIQNGTIVVNAIDDGIRGKDFLLITGGNFTVTSGGDALKSDNEDDTDKGYISIQDGIINIISGDEGLAAANSITVAGGTVTINAQGDGLKAENDTNTIYGTVTIEGGVLDITSADEGISALNSVLVSAGSITIDAQGDGLRAKNDYDTTLGAVTINNGTFDITAAGDAISAQTTVSITDGDFTLESGGGNTVIISEDLSAKGIKGDGSVSISGGTFDIDAAEDGLHSNTDVIISGGTFNLAVADDGIHADSNLEIDGGTINVTTSYEGIEAQIITINAGTIYIVASDDGINAAGGDETPINPYPQFPPSGTSSNNYLYINGGYCVVNAEGDGIDVNGSIEMTAGTIIVFGPTEGDNGSLDYDVSFTMTGGFLVAAGSSRMAMTTSMSSTQYSVMITYSQTKAAGTLVNIQKSGTTLLTFAPEKQYQSVVFSAPTLVAGSGYTLYSGGTSTGTLTDGVYYNGDYTPGTQLATFSIYNIITNVSTW